MKEISLDEAVGGQRHLLPFGPVGVFVGEDYFVIGKRDNPRIGYGPSPDIPGKIEEYALTVMARSDVDAPVLLIECIPETLPLRDCHPGGKGY